MLNDGQQDCAFIDALNSFYFHDPRGRTIGQSKKQVKWGMMWAYGARREGRTPTLLREPDFESGASASSAIRAKPKSRGATSNMKSNKGQSSKAPGYPSFI